MSGPEDNPRDDEQPTKEEWEKAMRVPSLLARADAHMAKHPTHDLVASLAAEVRKLQAFKAFVHARLDGMDVPEEFPDGEHTKEGCRVGDRLDYVAHKLHRLAGLDK